MMQNIKDPNEIAFNAYEQLIKNKDPNEIAFNAYEQLIKNKDKYSSIQIHQSKFIIIHISLNEDDYSIIEEYNNVDKNLNQHRIFDLSTTKNYIKTIPSIEFVSLTERNDKWDSSLVLYDTLSF